MKLSGWKKAFVQQNWPSPPTKRGSTIVPPCSFVTVCLAQWDPKGMSPHPKVPSKDTKPARNYSDSRCHNSCAGWKKYNHTLGRHPWWQRSHPTSGARCSGHSATQIQPTSAQPPLAPWSCSCLWPGWGVRTYGILVRWLPKGLYKHWGWQWGPPVR